MRLPREAYQIELLLGTHLPELRPSLRHGLTLWVYGTLLAGSACQTAVIAALLPLAEVTALRQYLREWLYDGAERAAPCATQLDVTTCFAPLLRWIVRWWQGTELALAIDATYLGDHVVVLAVNVLYRGSAMPIAWAVLPANQPGTWLEPILTLLTRLAPAVPPTWTVLVLADRGLWSPRLWRGIRAHGWHPVLRLQRQSTFRPAGQRRQRADTLIPGTGHAWVGAGTAFKVRAKRQQGTLVVVWATGAVEPWVVLTDLPPDQIGVCWYGLRVWVELGFRALKGVGWQWQRTRRTDPDRVARHWLVLAVATLLTMAVGTRAEDAALRGVPPAQLHVAPKPPPPEYRRPQSVFAQGRSWLRWQLWRGRRLWRRLWLNPAAWPPPTPDLVIYRVLIPMESAHA